MPKITDLDRWRVEVELAEEFRKDQFGDIDGDNKTKAGVNIDLYEKGFDDRYHMNTDVDPVTTLNIIDAIVSIIVPSLYFQNPRTIAVPEKIESEESAPVAGKTIDHFRKRMEAERINQKIIWDAYVLGYGVYKVGYVTKFGKDVKDPDKKPKTLRDRVNDGLEDLGLRKPEEKDVLVDQDLRIVAESPFLEYINPFDFGIDPRASSLETANFWYHRVRKSVKDMKENKRYKNTEQLQGTTPDVDSVEFNKVPESEMDAFKTVDLFEIHYRNDDFYILYMSCDASGEWREHLHEKSIYQMNEWQCDMLSFKSHGHALYPRSDISKIKNLQDRITTTTDAILEQVDKFVPKLAYQSGGLTQNGERALKDGGIGSLVETTSKPADVFKELNFTQLKTDLQQLIDQLITLISIQTGITRAQLTGLSDAGTATEATIEQGGQNLRISDMSGKVTSFVNRQSRKLWKVVKQFVDLEELQLINGRKGVDPETGLPKYDWLVVPEPLAERMQRSEYDFDLETGSTQQINLGVVRKSFENMLNILARTEVIALIQQQGDDVKLAEILKSYIDLFPELGMDNSKVIQKNQRPIPVQETRGGTTSGSNTNELRAQQAEQAPNLGNVLQEAQQI